MGYFLKLSLLTMLGLVYLDGGVHGYHVHSESLGRFFCFDNTGLTVPEYKVCDGFDDCWDGSDELGCHEYEHDHSHHNHHSHHHHHHDEYEHHHNDYCLETEFQCTTRYGSQCIPRHWVCDNYVDCMDGRDEEEQECSCGGEQEKLCENFYSGTRFCVPWHVSCNSYYDTYFYGGASGGSHNKQDWWHGGGWGRYGSH